MKPQGQNTSLIVRERKKRAAITCYD